MKVNYNLIININDEYAIPAVIMLRSFHEHHMKASVNVLVLHAGICAESVQLLKKHVEKYASLRFVNVNQETLRMLPVTGHISYEAYLRVFAFAFFDDDVERAMYIDSDMIINKNMRDFYYQDFEDSYLIACEDPTISHRNKVVYENLGMKIEDAYFNSGLIVFNIAKLRQNNNMMNKLIQYIEDNKEKIHFHDQDVLNGFFYKKAKIINNQWYNFFVIEIVFPSQCRRVKDNAYVIHYVDRWKPWKQHYIGFLFKEYQKYARLEGIEIKNSLNFKDCIRFLYIDIKRIAKRIIEK